MAAFTAFLDALAVLGGAQVKRHGIYCDGDAVPASSRMGMSLIGTCASLVRFKKRACSTS